MDGMYEAQQCVRTALISSKFLSTKEKSKEMRKGGERKRKRTYLAHGRVVYIVEDALPSHVLELVV